MLFSLMTFQKESLPLLQGGKFPSEVVNIAATQDMT